MVECGSVLQGVGVRLGHGVEAREVGGEIDSSKRDEEGEGAHWGVISPVPDPLG